MNTVEPARAEPAAADDAAFFEALRRREFARLDACDIAYLDYTGSALHAASQAAAHQALLDGEIFGNPHAAHAPSGRSTAAIAAARGMLLRFFGVDASTHVVCFTANATAAAKLVGESFPFGPSRPLLIASDNHNSVNGLREYARRAGAAVTTIRLTADLQLDDAGGALRSTGGRGAGGLLALPAQSNFSGACHALSLVAEAQDRGWTVLLDAAAWVPTHPLDLDAVPADFVTVSFYKMFGLPTGLGALVARRDAIARLQRPWFAGGTVAYVSVEHGRHRLRAGAEGFEDGTPHFLGIAELPFGMGFLERIGMTRIQARVEALTRDFVARLAELRHRDGQPLVAIYGPADMARRGGTIAFNVLDRTGVAVPYDDVETRARSAGVAIRGGCFCNPGASEAAFAFDSARSAECFSRLASDFSSGRLRSCLGARASVGAVRVSFGVPTVSRDLDRALDVVRSFTP